MVRAALALAVCLGACKPTLATTAGDGVRFVDLFTEGGDENSLFIVAMHGRGGSAELNARLWRNTPVKAQIAVAQGSVPFGDGWAWYEWPPGKTHDQVAPNILAAEEHLWKAIVDKAHGRKIVVSGFSQGAIMSYVLAARHPDVIIAALPVAGMAPPPLYPTQPAAPVYAFHGSDDNVIEIAADKNSIDAFKRAGGVAELREFPGVGHALQPMREALFERLRLLDPNARR